MLLVLAKMIEMIFKNQVLMTFLIASAWLIPGVIFTFATNRKYKKRQRDRRLKKISKLYPQP
tara:strand:- start:325 stop:510 length:186 start_codon:yes stop_codon:yes gene_type:complete